MVLEGNIDFSGNWVGNVLGCILLMSLDILCLCFKYFSEDEFKNNGLMCLVLIILK